MKLTPNMELNGMVGWRCPSNIAFIKYWGKATPQIPKNPSLSMTLSSCYTETKVHFKTVDDTPEIIFYFEGKQNFAFQERIKKYLQGLHDVFPFLRYLHLHIHSKNSFPHSAGIASSASAFGALALCLCEIETKITDVKLDQNFYQKASKIARLGSGSASRSVFGNFVIWGKSVHPGSSDLFAIPYTIPSNSPIHQLQDFILVVSSKQKKVSSSQGHQLMEDHPYAKARYLQANSNLKKIIKALEASDINLFGTVLEEEALAIHALMLSSKKSYFLLTPETLKIIEIIRDFRKKSGIPAFFTLDAGPNVHLIYEKKYTPQIEQLIADKCNSFVETVIKDAIGNGPIQTEVSDK